MILTVKNKRKRKEKHHPIRNVIKFVLIITVLMIVFIVAYNYLFIVKYVDAPKEMKVTVDKIAIGKPLFRINKRLLLNKLDNYPDFDIKMIKMIPGKLIIRKKAIEPEVYIVNRNIYVDSRGDIFKVNNKVLYTPLKVFGNIGNSQMNNFVKISKERMFKVIHVYKGYYIGKIGDVKICFTKLDKVMIDRIKLVMSKESSKHYTMDLRFKNQVIIR